MADPKLKLGNDIWATKQKSLLAYNDEGGNFKSLPFQVERISGGTYVGRNGLVQTAASNEPRIDFLNNTKGHLLLEGSRTNFLTYSESFSDWALNGDSISETLSTAFGKTIWTITESSSSSLGVYRNATGITIGTITSSVLVKANTSNTFTLRYGSPTDKNVVFNLSNGSITFESSGASGTITSYGGGWYLCTNTVTITSSTQSFAIYTNNGSIDVIYAQLEAGSYATSYIPTSGSAVTRSAETAVDSGNTNVFNDSEGVLYAEVSALANDGTTREMALSDGGASNRIEVRYVSSANDIQAVIRGAASTILLSYTLSDATEFAKVAVKYKSGDYALWIDGVERAVSTTTGTPTGLSQFAFDDGNGGFNIYSKVKDIKVYNTALSDSELQVLTS